MKKSRQETEESRKRILSAATRMFLADGLAQTGIASIMQAAGLTQGGFYRHFRSKEQLIVEASKAANEHMFAAFAQAVAGRAHAGGGLLQILRRQSIELKIHAGVAIHLRVENARSHPSVGGRLGGLDGFNDARAASHALALAGAVGAAFGDDAMCSDPLPMPEGALESSLSSRK